MRKFRASMEPFRDLKIGIKTCRVTYTPVYPANALKADSGGNNEIISDTCIE